MILIFYDTIGIYPKNLHSFWIITCMKLN